MRRGIKEEETEEEEARGAPKVLLSQVPVQPWATKVVMPLSSRDYKDEQVCASTDWCEQLSTFRAHSHQSTETIHVISHDDDDDGVL